MALFTMNLLLDLLLLLGVVHITRKAFKFEQIGRFEHVILPIYSLIMFFSGMVWQTKNILIMFFLIIISILIGYYQASKVDFKVTPNPDSTGRPVVSIKKNRPYIVGWFLVFIIGALFSLWLEPTAKHSLITEFAKEVEGDLWLGFNFGAEKTWFTWLLAGASSFSFVRFLQRKDPHVQAALKGKRRSNDTSH
ncbi:hypothetical protein FC83_GL001173 [Agrilactobacillus composti DSM 18527 = JCM 14202]|uniref:Hydrophobic protein n=2 Tax=Agrilactobacillus TaxID=2767875 RepID=A0A0R1XMM3_9LACO|nr:hypothetical protein FC83_GL001173 [Agrilactobacillus composti DSM 18527 = JCM 14202]